MNATLVHAAVFGIGAAAGATVASAVLERRRAVTVVPTQPTVVVEAPGTGGAMVLPTKVVGSDVLKYGNPGMIQNLLKLKPRTMELKFPTRKVLL